MPVRRLAAMNDEIDGPATAARLKIVKRPKRAIRFERTLPPIAFFWTVFGGRLAEQYGRDVVYVGWEKFSWHVTSPHRGAK